MAFSFLQKQIYISPATNAAISTVVVLGALVLSERWDLGALAGFLVVSMQSISGINVKGSLKLRLYTAAIAAAVIVCTAVLGAFTKEYFITSALGMFLLAVCFGFCRQAFPLNAPDIIIPGGIVYFMSISEAHFWEPMQLAFLGVSLALMVQVLVGLISPTKTEVSLADIPAQNAPSDLKSGNEAAPPTQISEVNKRFKLTPYIYIYSLELEVALLIGLLFHWFTTYKHWYWMPLTAIVVLQVSQNLTKKRIRERILGTFAGCLIGSLLLLLHPGGIFLMGLIGISIFLFMYLIPKNYAVGATFVTIFVLLLMGSQTGHPMEIAVERLAFTLLGGALVYITSLFFLKKKQL